MDFAFSEEQVALRTLAREILGSEVTLERLKEVEAGRAWFDGALWSRLAEANLLGLAVPEPLGGMGYGILELCVLLQEIGRAVAPVPAWASLLTAGLPLARWGSEAQRKEWLAPLAAGQAILSAALVDADSTDPAAPATAARRDGAGWVLDGRKRLVPAADRAARVLVPATAGEGAGLFLVDPRGAGVSLRGARTTTGETLFELELAGARAGAGDLLFVGGAGRLAALHDQALVGLCATQVGVSERALEITTAYLKQREQFGAPLGSFPVVQHRCADAFIDLEAMRWTTWRAAWLLSAGRPAARAAAVAKFWAADAGSRIANATQHLHGGIGVDRDYAIHRYFLWTRSLELCLGGATPQLARLGRDMARRGPPEPA